METLLLLLILGLVFLTAFMFAPLGLGGGMLFVPILHYIAGWPIDGGLLLTSLALTMVGAYGSGLAHRKAGHWSVEGRNLALRGAVPGAFVGVAIAVTLGDAMDLAFKIISAIMIAWAIQKTWRKLKAEATAGGEEAAEDATAQELQLGLGASIGGMLSAVLGIGAGAIYIPILRQYGKVPARAAIGTSFGIMMVVVPVALMTHGFALAPSQVEFLLEQGILVLGPAAMISTFAGSQIGAKIGLRFLPTRAVMGIFFGLLLLILVRYLVDVAGRVSVL